MTYPRSTISRYRFWMARLLVKSILVMEYCSYINNNTELLSCYLAGMNKFILVLYLFCQ